jgi:hypothetical protein
MQKSTFGIIASSLLLTAAPALAGKQGENKDDPNRRVCKLEERTASRLPGKKICKTKAEWEQQAQDAVDAARLRSRSN